MSGGPESTIHESLGALMFTDIEGSVAWQQKLGTVAYGRLVEGHDQLLRECLDTVRGADILDGAGDGFLVRFALPSHAVSVALLLQYRLAKEGCGGVPLRVRIGLHLGVVTEIADVLRQERRIVGMAINLTARVMGMARGGQILMSKVLYDDAMHYLKSHPEVPGGGEPPALVWVSHGDYRFRGSDQPMELYEVGAEGIGVLEAPAAGGKGRPVGGAGGVVEEPAGRPEELKESHVVLAYAPMDDRTAEPGKRGWISQFEKNLGVRLEQLWGEKVKIWRDGEGGGEGVMEHLPEAKTMVSVVSPPFAKSPGCLREVEAFWNGAEERGDLRLGGGKKRLMKVVKSPVAEGEVPDGVARLLEQVAGYDFFETDPVTGRSLEFDEAFGERAKQRYYERIYDLAYEIRDVLQAYAAGETGGDESAKATVYLAETTSDLASERDVLKRELLERGYRVVPDRPLPRTAGEIEREVGVLLGEADFAVHPVGLLFGMVPEGTEESIVELQNRVAAAAGGGVRRLIWLPVLEEGLKPGERQEAFLKRVEEVPELHRGGEVVRGTLEGFKRVMLEVLEGNAAPVAEEEAGVDTDGARTVYLICDPRDSEAVEPLEDVLYDLGFEVVTPVMEGSEEELTRAHRDRLLRCDGALVYFGKSSKPWVEMKVMDLMQAPGWGRTRALAAKGVFVADDGDRRKARFRTRLAEVIHGGEAGRIDADVLAPFVEAMRRGVEGGVA